MSHRKAVATANPMINANIRKKFRNNKNSAEKILSHIL